MSKITEACQVLREFAKNVGATDVQINVGPDGRIALLAYRKDGSNILRKNGNLDLGPRPEDIIAAWWNTR